MLIFLFFPFIFKRVVYAPFVGESWMFGKQIKAAILSECSLMYVYLLI